MEGQAGGGHGLGDRADEARLPERVVERDRRVAASCPGIRKAPATNMTGPATAAAATTRQRRDRSRPLGTSRAGRVTPRAMAGAQIVTSAMASSLATRGSGRWSRTSWSIQGPSGMIRLQVSAEAAYSQPIGLAGRRRVRIRPTVAYPSGKPRAYRAPSTDDLGGERPGDQQRDHQPGDAAAHGGQPQRPGEHGPGPRLRRHRILEVGSCTLRGSQPAGTGSLRPADRRDLRGAGRSGWRRGWRRRSPPGGSRPGGRSRRRRRRR